MIYLVLPALLIQPEEQLVDMILEEGAFFLGAVGQCALRNIIK